MKKQIKGLARKLVLRYAPERLYPTPPIRLAPERLYVYLDALWRHRAVDGAVVEVGCWLGGTAALASKMLERIGADKRYVCVDTFAGFVPEQFDRDREHGTPEGSRHAFSENSIELVRRLLAHYQADRIELVEGDIATLPDERLPDRIAVCLLDVDLEVPVYEGLRRIYPRLVGDGVILVDDCAAGHKWGAGIGYRRFVEEQDLPAEYFLGMGIVRRP